MRFLSKIFLIIGVASISGFVALETAHFLLVQAMEKIPEAHGDFPAWVQAVATVWVIPISLFIAYWQYESSQRDGEAIRRKEEEEYRRKLASMLAAEMIGLKKRVEGLAVVDAFKSISHILADGSASEPFEVFSARGNVTVIYDTAGYRIGALGADLAGRVVETYVSIKGIMETMNNFADSLDKITGNGEKFQKARKHHAQMAEAIAAELERLMDAGSATIDALQGVAGKD